MAMMIGVLLALAVGAFTTAVGFGRERGFYPTVTIVVASYYVLFAAMGATTGILVVEMVVGAVFVACAAFGFRSSLWIVVAALAGHGVMDLFHGDVIANPGVPAWWPPFCSGYDLAAAAYLAWLLGRGRIGRAAGE